VKILHEMCLPTFYKTHTKISPYFSNRCTIHHNRQTYTVRDGVSFVFTVCSHYNFFSASVCTPQETRPVSPRPIAARYEQTRTSSCEVRYFCLILAKTGINRRPLVKSRNMKFHANSRGGSGTTPCCQTDDTSSRFSQLFYEHI